MQIYGRHIAVAYEWLKKYQESRMLNDLHQAWGFYFRVLFQLLNFLPMSVNSG